MEEAHAASNLAMWLLAALGSALGALILYYIARVDRRGDQVWKAINTFNTQLAEMEKRFNERCAQLERLVRQENRHFGERLVQIEAHLWPRARPTRATQLGDEIEHDLTQ